MSNKTKRIVILTELELRKTLSRLTSEIIEKVKNLDNLLLVGIPTRGIDLTEVLAKELLSRTIYLSSFFTICQLLSIARLYMIRVCLSFYEYP